MNLNCFLTTAWDCSNAWGLLINPAKCNCATIGGVVFLSFFFSEGAGTPVPVPKLVKEIGVQTDNVFSLSVQYSEAANEARRLNFMIRRSSQVLPKLAFIPLYGALGRLLLKYGTPACSTNLVADINHLARNQRLATVTSPTKRNCSRRAFIP